MGKMYRRETGEIAGYDVAIGWISSGETVEVLYNNGVIYTYNKRNDK